MIDRPQGAQWWFESKDDQCETRYFVELFYITNVLRKPDLDTTYLTQSEKWIRY